MSLTALLREGSPKGHKRDKVSMAYEKLPQPERAAFATLVKDPIWSAPQIAETLRKMGHDVTGDQIQHFRSKIRDGRVEL
jgi:hypothetical protein